MRHPTSLPILLIVVPTLAAACGKPAKEETIAEAFRIESKQEKAAEAVAEAKAEQREQQAQVRAAARATIDAAVDRAAQMPEVRPEDIGAACEAVMNAYDAFMKTGPERDALEWSDGRRRKLGERKAACLKVDKLEVAACEATALDAAPAELDELPRIVAARHLMERCHEKFGE
jgi:hypothetical protein